MSDFKQYRKKKLAEMRPFVAGETLTGVSISDEDAKNGSPKSGDFIARDPDDHSDEWLVSAAFVAANYEAM